MNIVFLCSPCTTRIYRIPPLPSQYRRVQLIVSHFICWGGKNVAFPFFLPLPPCTGEPLQLDSAAAKRFFVLRMGLQLITSRSNIQRLHPRFSEASIRFVTSSLLQFFKVASSFE